MRALGSDSHRPLFLKAAARKAVCLILLLVGGSCCIVLEAERHPFHTKTFERISKASCSACGYLSAAEVWPRTQPRSSSSFWGPRSQGRQGTSIRTSTSGVRSHLRLNKGFQSLRAAEGTATPGLIPEKQQHEREAESPPQIDLARALQLLEAASGEDPLPNTSPRKEGDDGVSSRSPRTPKGPHEEMDMRGKRRLSVIFNCMLHACERQGDALGGFEVYRQMQTLGVPPDEATFHSVAALMERTGEYNGMIKLLDHMQSQGRKPSLSVLGLAISCCSKAGAAAAALQLSQQLQREIRAAAAAVSPSETFAAAKVSDAAAGLQQQDEHISTAATALQQALPSSVYASLVSCCSASGRHEKALQLYAEFSALKEHQEVLQKRLAKQQQQQQEEQQQQQQLQRQQQSRDELRQTQLEPETVQHLQQVLRRDSFFPTTALVNAALASAAATGRLQLALHIYRRDLLLLQQQQQQHGEDHFSEEVLGACSAAEPHAPTTQTFLLLLAAAAAQQSSSTVGMLLRDFEQQQQQRQQQQLLPLDAPAVYAAAAEALAVGGRWQEGLGLLIRSHSERQQHQQKAIQQLQNLISTQQQLERQQLQRQVLQLLQAYPPSGSVSPYLATLRCCSAAAAPREALGILRLLQQRQLQQQQLFRLQQQLQQQNLTEAEETLTPQIPLCAFVEVMAAAAAAEDWRLLLSVAAEFDSPKVQQQNAEAVAAGAATASRTTSRLRHSHASSGTEAAARAATAALEQHVPLEVRVRVAALKLLGLLHAGLSQAAAKQRRQLLLLLQDGSGSEELKQQGQETLSGQLQQDAAAFDPITEKALKLAQELLGPAEQQQPQASNVPHAAALLNAHQGRPHQNIPHQQTQQLAKEHQQQLEDGA